ncbi:MAG: hydroxyacylglutathione hydrolase, partial [Pseudomonadota bacterium]
EFVQFVAREDNFCVLVHDPVSGRTASVDAPDADTIQSALDARGWHLDVLLITHHHFDHVAGIDALSDRHGCEVIGPSAEADKIAGLSRTVSEGDTFDLFGEPVQVIDTPGHTLGHIAFYLPTAGVLFAGDTLFSLGCGKLFEGSPEQMWSSLQKIMALPSDTVIYVGHDYTVENGEYALQWESSNAALQARMRSARSLQDDGQPTLPTTLQQELETNPFLRPQSTALRSTLDMPTATDLDVFTRVRELRG